MVVGAYASLVSIVQVLDQALKLHGQGRIRLDINQIEILRGKFVFFLRFLHKTNSRELSAEIKSLTEQISSLAVRSEYIINDEIGYQFCGSSGGVSISAVAVVVEKIEKIKGRIEEIDSADLTYVDSSDDVFENVVSSSDLDSVATVDSQSAVKLVGFEDRVSWVIDKLTNDDKSLQVIPIVGMGGIGKTTLARSVYDHPNIQRRFDRQMWCTVSQKYDVIQILQNLLKGDQSSPEIRELGNRLHKKLYCRRYLIVMDDIWDVEACECLKMHLPDNENGSRVIVTTRNLNVASSICSYYTPCALSVLDDNTSWDLLRKNIFGENGICPDELQIIGENIARSCKGLPLSLVTMAGVLSTSDMTISFWQYVAENVRRFASSADDNHCLKVLSLSYHCLPIHLKPCFLYLRKYREDETIDWKDLTQRWIAEGFVELPVGNKTIEEVAKEYLKDLTDRNLIQISTKNYLGEIKRFNVHDLVWDFCITESSKENFVSTVRIKSFRIYANDKCSICGCHLRLSDENMSWLNPESSPICEKCEMECCSAGRSRSDDFMKYHTTLRFIQAGDLNPDIFPLKTLPHFFNVQFLCINDKVSDREFSDVVWKMSHLRYLVIPRIILYEPSSDSFLSELQTLHVGNLRFSKSLVRWIPNLKKLKLGSCDYERDDLEYSERVYSLSCYDSKMNEIAFGGYDKIKNYKCVHHSVPFINCIYGNDSFTFVGCSGSSKDELKLKDHECDHSLHLLECFRQLESFAFKGRLDFSKKKMKNEIKFPCSLRKLVLRDIEIDWDEMMMGIGSLPDLRVLKLINVRDRGNVREWKMKEGGFRSLMKLTVYATELDAWRGESHHLPVLGKLLVYHEKFEIPSDFGNIDTLNSILVYVCSDQTCESAERLFEEQLQNGNEIQVYIDDRLLHKSDPGE